MMRARPLSVSLVAANLVLAGIALWPWLPARGTVEPPAAPAEAATAPQRISLPPAAELTATTERPLFSPTRRPGKDAPAASIESRYRLQGLVIAGATRHALMVPTAGGRAIELGEGQMLEGWTVKRIERDSVLLAGPTGETRLGLQSGGAKR
jgi:hypothetical protein